jgi:hypothetical protein
MTFQVNHQPAEVMHKYRLLSKKGASSGGKAPLILGESGGEVTRKMRVLADLTIDSLNIGGTLKRASTRKMRMENPHVKRSRMVISTFK